MYCHKNHNSLSTPEPHYIPGYAGHCPGYIGSVGQSYGPMTHELLLDPCVHQTKKLNLSGLDEAEGYLTQRPPQSHIDLVNRRPHLEYKIYKHPMIPGYQGFIPRLEALSGERFAVLATEALSNYQKTLCHIEENKKQLTQAVEGQKPLQREKSPDENVNQTFVV